MLQIQTNISATTGSEYGDDVTVWCIVCDPSVTKSRRLLQGRGLCDRCIINGVFPGRTAAEWAPARPFVGGKHLNKGKESMDAHPKLDLGNHSTGKYTTGSWTIRVVINLTRLNYARLYHARAEDDAKW